MLTQAASLADTNSLPIFVASSLLPAVMYIKLVFKLSPFCPFGFNGRVEFVPSNHPHTLFSPQNTPQKILKDANPCLSDIIDCKISETVAVRLNAHQAPQTVSRSATKYPSAYNENLGFGYRTKRK
jgi:hypothetical protein